jgi:DNA-binding CsgD family transcriptional regulator
MSAITESAERHHALGGAWRFPGVVAVCDHQVMVRRVSSAVLVGRDDELSRLRAALRRAVAGTPATVVVAGEAGVGKTRLVLELAREAQAAGVVVLVGGCLDVGGDTLPYAPLAEALRSLPMVLGADELAVVLEGARGELARLVPELGEAAAGAVETPPGRFLELLLGMLHRLAEGRAVVLVVEDLHWADRSTRDLLAFLVRNLRRGVTLLLTVRSDELHRRHPLRPFLAELERGGRVERIDLGRLSRRELTELLTGIFGEMPAAGLVADVWGRSDGNPFFAEELAAAHAEGTQLPEALRDLLLARVEALPEATQRVLQVAAVAGRRVDHHLLATVAGEPEEELVELLREAVLGHVLVEVPGGGYAFRHALVQEAIYDDLLQVERGPLHAAYARALAERVQEHGGHATAVELGQLAHHWYAANDLRAALPAAIRAAVAAEATYAHAEAFRHYERALELLEQAPAAAVESPLDRTGLLESAAKAAYQAGEVHAAIRLGRLALGTIHQATEPLRAAVVLELLSRCHWYASPDLREATEAMEQALAVVPVEPPTQELAMVLAGHGRLLLMRGRNREAAGVCERAIAVARQAGAPAEEASALTTLGTAVRLFGQIDEGVAHLERARALAEEVGAITEVGRSWINHSQVLLSAGRCEEAAQVAREGLAVLRRLGLARAVGMIALGNAAEALTLLGRWDEADRLLDQAVDLDLPGPIVAVLRVNRAHCRLRRGEAAATRAELTQLLEDVSSAGFPDPQAVKPLCELLAEAAIWEGCLDDARDAVANGLAMLAGTDDPENTMSLCMVGLAAEAARVERTHVASGSGEAGDVDESRQVAAALVERARELGKAMGTALLPPARAALLAAEAEWSRVAGHGDPARWADAAAAWDALGYPWPATYARWRQAEALLTGGAARRGASELLNTAWETARQLGAALLQREIEALATRARIELGPAAAELVAAAPSEAARLGLTERELEVLKLLGTGLTNRQIAEKLFISPKTASVHVSNILRKLDVANRVQAGAIAQRLISRA